MYFISSCVITKKRIRAGTIEIEGILLTADDVPDRG